MKPVVINNLPPVVMRALVRLSKAPIVDDDAYGLENCSDAAKAFFRVLATSRDGMETSAIASEMKITTRSLPPLIRAAKVKLAEYGDSFDRYVERDARFRRGKPYSLYKLTEYGRKALIACGN